MAALDRAATLSFRFGVTIRLIQLLDKYDAQIKQAILNSTTYSKLNIKLSKTSNQMKESHHMHPTASTTDTVTGLSLIKWLAAGTDTDTDSDSHRRNENESGDGAGAGGRLDVDARAVLIEAFDAVIRSSSGAIPFTGEELTEAVDLFNVPSSIDLVKPTPDADPTGSVSILDPAYSYVHGYLSHEDLNSGVFSRLAKKTHCHRASHHAQVA